MDSLVILAQQELSSSERFFLYPMFLLVFVGVFWCGLEKLRNARSAEPEAEPTRVDKSGSRQGLPEIIRNILLCGVATLGVVSVLFMIIAGQTLLPF